MSGSAYQDRMASRQAEFKRGIDGDEARRGRDENLLSLRKNKREDKLAKRRQQAPEPQQQQQSGGNPTVQMPLTVPANASELNQWVAKLHGNSFEEVYEATVRFRKLLSLEKSPPIQMVIDAGIVPKLVHLCTAVQYPKLQYEAAWALTNIASGNSAQTKVVVEAGSIPIFVKLLMSPDENVREQSIWALGNMAGDCTDYRDTILKLGAMPALVENLQRTTKLTMLRNGTWTMSNLARGKPSPAYEYVAPALPCLAKLITSTDEETLTDACWALSYLSDGSAQRIQGVVQSGVLPILAKLVNHSNASIQTPALRTIGNVATGDDKMTDAVVNSGAVPQLVTLMKSARKAVRKEAVWTISNITAGSKVQIQSVINAGAIPELVRILSEGEWEVKKEAAWAISNFCSGGSKDHIRLLVSKKAIKPLCDLLACEDPKIILVALEAIKHILNAGESDGSKFGSNQNAYADMIEDADGLDKIEGLQEHSNEKVYEKAVEIIERFFQEDEGENLGGLAAQQQGGAFTFDNGSGFGSGGFGTAPSFSSNGFAFGGPQQPQMQQQQQQQQGFAFGGGQFAF